jgi:UDP-N-acetylmuramoyl-tripeptide--D-alanyl-D-alanine ligase
MIVIVIFALFTTLFAGWRAWRRLRYFLHIFQLEGYKPGEFVLWIRHRAGRVLLRLSHKLAVAELAIGFFGFFYWSPYWTAVILLPLWSITFASSAISRKNTLNTRTACSVCSQPPP